MQLDESHALVILSGGQDSTICLGWALENYQFVSAVSFDYGQKHSIELESAKKIVAEFNKRMDTGDEWARTIQHEIVKLGANILGGTSPLTNPDEQLETYDNHDEMEKIIGDRIEKTFVPMRNAVFLMVAANRAAVLGAQTLVTGVCQADNANYPDCTQAFIDATGFVINQALGFGEDVVFRIETPLMDLSKAESIELAVSLDNGTYEMLQWSHTAYDGKYPPTGKDHASVLRAHGFEQANYPDPLVVRAWREDKMELPKTANYSPTRLLDVGI